ncbi:odorant receptor 131-2-like [Festucalex cinctus]
MSGNNSLPAGGEDRLNFPSFAMLIQVLITVFLGINFFLLATFFTKDQFLLSMRYILFANMLLNDCCFLVMSDVLILLHGFAVSTQLWLCMLFYFVLAISNLATACTLAAMTLERYVAVCMPLRHGELCSSQRALGGVALIGGLSCIPFVVFFLAIFASVAGDHYVQERMCSVIHLEVYPWHSYLRSAMFLVYFLAMGGVIVFCYVRIMRVANAVSVRDREASRKGLSTVTLHGFQLVLCLVYLLIPLVEKALAQVDFALFEKVRFFNYIALVLTPRCLSPLVYGLRDEMFFKALKLYAQCRLSRKIGNVGKRQNGHSRGHAKRVNP